MHPFCENIILSGSDVPELTAIQLKNSIKHLGNFNRYIIGTEDGDFVVLLKLKNLENVFSSGLFHRHILDDLIRYQ